MSASFKHSSTALASTRSPNQFTPSTVEQREEYEKVLPHPEFSAKNNSVILPLSGIASILAVAAVTAAIPGFVVMPFAIKQFKPEWSYKKRTVAGFGILTGLGLVRSIIKKL